MMLLNLPKTSKNCDDIIIRHYKILVYIIEELKIRNGTSPIKSNEISLTNKNKNNLNVVGLQ